MITRDSNSITATVVENENVASRVDFTLNISANLYDMSSDDIASEYEREDNVPIGFAIEPTADAPVNCDYILTVDDDVEYSDALGDGRCSAYQFVDCSYDEDTHECRIYKYYRQHIDDEEYFVWVSRFEFMGDVYDKWRKIDTESYESYVLTQPIVETNSNYRKGVLCNYVAFRVMRCTEQGRHEYGEEGVDWIDVTCGENSAGFFSGKMNDVIVYNLPVYDGATEPSPRYDLLFTKYNDPSMGYCEYWLESSDNGGRDVPSELIDFDYAVNFGDFFDATVYNEQGFEGKSYDWFDNVNNERDYHMNYNTVMQGNAVSINYHSDNNHYTYYIEFRYPMLLMGEGDTASGVGWACDSYYVYPFWDGATYFSEYAEDTCAIPTASVSTILSADFSTLSLNEYEITLTDADNRFFALQSMDITFDLRKNSNVRKIRITSVEGGVGTVSIDGNELELPYTGYFVVGERVDIRFEAHPDGSILNIIDNGEDVMVGGTVCETTYDPIDIDHTIIVEFAEVNYEVTTLSETPLYGSISGGGTYRLGSDATISISPSLTTANFKHKLQRLTDNITDVTSFVRNNRYVIENIGESHDVVSTFVRVFLYDVDIAPVLGGGTTKPLPRTITKVESGEDFEVIIVPDRGWYPSLVLDNEDDVTSVVRYDSGHKRYYYTMSNISGDHRIVVRFARNPD